MVLRQKLLLLTLPYINSQTIVQYIPQNGVYNWPCDMNIAKYFPKHVDNEVQALQIYRQSEFNGSINCLTPLTDEMTENDSSVTPLSSEYKSCPLCQQGFSIDTSTLGSFSHVYEYVFPHTAPRADWAKAENQEDRPRLNITVYAEKTSDDLIFNDEEISSNDELVGSAQSFCEIKGINRPIRDLRVTFIQEVTTDGLGSDESLEYNNDSIDYETEIPESLRFGQAADNNVNNDENNTDNSTETLDTTNTAAITDPSTTPSAEDLMLEVVTKQITTQDSVDVPGGLDYKVEYEFKNTKGKENKKFKLECRIDLDDDLNDDQKSVLVKTKTVTIGGQAVIKDFSAFPSNPSVGEEFKITCEASGSPAPTVQITDSQNNLVGNSTKYVATTSNKTASMSDHKVYTCTATNGNGEPAVQTLAFTVNRHEDELDETDATNGINVVTSLASNPKDKTYNVNEEISCAIKVNPEPSKLVLMFKAETAAAGSGTTTDFVQIAENLTTTSYDSENAWFTIKHTAMNPGAYACSRVKYDAEGNLADIFSYAEFQVKNGNLLSVANILGNEILYVIILAAILLLVILIIFIRKCRSSAPEAENSDTEKGGLTHENNPTHCDTTTVANSSGHDLDSSKNKSNAERNENEVVDENAPLNPEN